MRESYLISEERVLGERFNKAFLHRCVGLFLLNDIDWNKNLELLL